MCERYYYCSCPESLMNVGLLLRKEKKKVTFGRKSVLPILKGCNECESTCERQTTLEVQLHN